ncbi:hypothetical protein LY76DRAFT_21204 [Colletotrichum caudatum]|nr:hypothetical protein LY76DRAFT_21204 [Colletotrichum caudatum]
MQGGRMWECTSNRWANCMSSRRRKWGRGLPIWATCMNAQHQRVGLRPIFGLGASLFAQCGPGRHHYQAVSVGTRPDRPSMSRRKHSEDASWGRNIREHRNEVGKTKILEDEGEFEVNN